MERAVQPGNARKLMRLAVGKLNGLAGCDFGDDDWAKMRMASSILLSFQHSKLNQRFFWQKILTAVV